MKKLKDSLLGRESIRIFSTAAGVTPLIQRRRLGHLGTKSWSRPTEVGDRVSADVFHPGRWHHVIGVRGMPFRCLNEWEGEPCCERRYVICWEWRSPSCRQRSGPQHPQNWSRRSPRLAALEASVPFSNRPSASRGR